MAVVINIKIGSEATDELQNNTMETGVTATENTQENILLSNTSKENKVSKNTSKKINAIAFASMVATRSFDYLTSNVGKWTGDHRNQTNINNAMQALSLAALFKISPLAAAADIGLNLAMTAIDNRYEDFWENKRLSQMQKSAGYNSSAEIIGRK